MTSTADTALLMDAVYRNQRHFYDLTRKYYLLGRDLLIDRLAPANGAHVLELGCGTGRNLIAAAKRYPQAHFYGIDISSQMLETARSNIERAGLSGWINLVQGDASDPVAAQGFGVLGFDRIFYSYTLSMIPVWREAIDAGLAQLAPAGRISVVDFGQQEGLPSVFRRLLFAWLQKFHVSPRADLEQALTNAAAARELAVSATSLYRGYAFYAEVGPNPQGLYSPATK
ncbi:class I SAM-dependent methyltransferase [Roseibium sp.]|uniref:class I SAM-dependent methyltransferase n=1 Tax=Roseibium sp. TaxID=1936156 RepID=UPI003A98431D